MSGASPARRVGVLADALPMLVGMVGGLMLRISS